MSLVRRSNSLLLASMMAVPLFTGFASAQGLNTSANKDDWEEINFDYNSSVLVDGFPSLLRIAELLQKNPGYKVKVEGHTDSIGGKAYNDKLGLARANAVRDFLVKYGARANQITTASLGFDNPRAAGEKKGYNRTDEARFMNRRVVLTVNDDQGRTVGVGGAGDAIRAIQQGGISQDCCNEILRRLDKLDAIERMLKDLADQNAALRNELAGLKQNQDALRQGLDNVRSAQDAARQNQQALENRIAEAPKPPTTSEVAKAVSSELRNANPRFSLLGINVGPSTYGNNATFSGRGRYFAPFGDHYAFQGEGEYLYTGGLREGQIDLGLVDRIGRFQAGLFSSFKHANLDGFQSGATLGQAALTAEYIFKWGKVGVFGTKAFLDNQLINSVSTPLNPSGTAVQITEQYLSVVDQAGVNTTAGLFGKNYLTANLGYLSSHNSGDHVGGSMRLVFPITDKIAFTAEGGVNETLVPNAINNSGTIGRAAFGLLFGSVLRPKDMLVADHATPVEIPRLRYEVTQRTVTRRSGNNPPVADAGSNQTFTASGTITLNGSSSYDPDNDPITYLWAQESGPAVTLSSPTSAVTTFAAVAGNTYTFRLTVKDSLGAQSSARVTISSISTGPPQILAFAATPATITQGQSTTIGWQAINADTVTITGLGNVAQSGSMPVSPATTTTYTITATRGSQSVTSSVTITVSPNTVNAPQILAFAATPATITQGQSSTLGWQVINADTVTISGVGSVAATGSAAVTPSATTTYTITATRGSQSVTSTVTITVNPSGNGVGGGGTSGPTKITSFFAYSSPGGLFSNVQQLACSAVNALLIDVNGIEYPYPTVVVSVDPAVTTNYTCTAYGPNGQIDTQTITVTPKP